MTPAIRFSGQTSVGELFAARAKSKPHHTAITFEKGAITYAKLDERATGLANWFVQMGYVTRDRVAVYLRNCPQYLELELAAAKCGLIVAAINWRLGQKELHHCLNLVEPVLVVTDSDLMEALHTLPGFSTKTLLIGEPYETAIADASSLAVAHVSDPETGLVILYTSGTTGLPKGALISHRAMIARSAAFASDLCLPASIDFIAWAPLYHMASTDHALSTLMRGGTVHVVDGYQPEKILDLIERHEIGWFVLMPGMIGDFVLRCETRKPKVRKIIACGAMADLVPRAELAAVTQALNTPYLNTFGATETGLPPASGNTIPIGTAPKTLSKMQSTFCEVRLVDPYDNDVENGEPGEVAVRGPTVFSGYWNAPQTNAHDFRNGWFHMGDVMRRNPDGTLDYVDRLKYMIKSGGENIYPVEIERVLEVDDRVETAVVVRKRDPKWGEVPVVFVVKANPELTEQEVALICDRGLSSYKRPKQVLFLGDDDLPRSTTGKIQRHELEKRLRR